VLSARLYAISRLPGILDHWTRSYGTQSIPYHTIHVLSLFCVVYSHCHYTRPRRRRWRSRASLGARPLSPCPLFFTAASLATAEFTHIASSFHIPPRNQSVSANLCCSFCCSYCPLHPSWHPFYCYLIWTFSSWSLISFRSLYWRLVLWPRFARRNHCRCVAGATA